VAELAQAEQVLERNPEHTAPGRILCDERRSDEDRSAHDSRRFVCETRRGVEPPIVCEALSAVAPSRRQAAG